MSPQKIKNVFSIKLSQLLIKMSESETKDVDGPVFERLMGRFESDVLEKVRAEAISGRLVEGGQIRIMLSSLTSTLIGDTKVQMDSPLLKFQLLSSWADSYLQNGEIALAKQTMQSTTDIINNLTGVTQVMAEIDSIRFIIDCERREITSSSQFYISPTSVSKLLRCMHTLREALESMYHKLSTTEQEECAWQILNCSKSLLDLAQTLIWYGCGKYITETMVFVAFSLDTVINLCTVRHMHFRMKIYTTAFYSVATHRSINQAREILNHSSTQLAELIEREELDAPVPEKTIEKLIEFETDLNVMKCVMTFLENPDSLASACEFSGNDTYKDNNDVVSFKERCLLECIRLQQLTSLNMNEVWQRRTSCLIQVIKPLLEDPETAKFTQGALLEFSIILMSSRDEEGEVKDIMKLIEKLNTTGLEAGGISLLPEFDMIHTLAKVIYFTEENDSEEENNLGEEDANPVPTEDQGGAEDSDANAHTNVENNKPEKLDKLETLLKLVEQIDDMIHVPEFSNRTTFLRRIILILWSKDILPTVQKAITRSPYRSEEAESALHGVLPALVSATRTLHIVSVEDPVFAASVALVTCQLLREYGDRRSAIALLKQSLDVVDDFRAARVDLLLNQSEDIRDIKAIQKMSFTTTATADDWFHAQKRLGAHAFAGHGIFGAGSSAERYDQAVAELQTDIWSLYFRVEIEYAMEQSAYKRNMRQKKTDLGETISDTRHFTTGRESMIGMADTYADKNASESLACVANLKRLTRRNQYANCLLYMELARIEMDGDKRRTLLDNAYACIEEVERNEKALIAAFDDLTMMCDKDRKHPIVLARSHNCIYAAPVGSRSINKAASYRMLAREEGSGGEITINNDDIAGCQIQVPLEDMVSPSRAAVPLQLLNPGERYMLGCVACRSDGETTGAVSPSTIPVEAVNPLPKTLLWAYFNQLAFDCGEASLCRHSAGKVYSRFFVPLPKIPTLVLGSGYNLFTASEPILCMLKFHQSSPLLLKGLVNSFLNQHYITAKEPTSSNIHWMSKMQKQVASINQLRDTATICIVASCTGSHEALLRATFLAHELVSELLQYDITNVAQYVQHALLTVLTCFNCIPKVNWKSIEHSLYVRLLHCACRCSLSKNSSSALNVFLQEAASVVMDSPEMMEPIMDEIRPNYASLFSVCATKNEILLSEDIKSKLIELLGLPTEAIPAEEFWQVSDLSRLEALKGAAITLSGEDKASHPYFGPLSASLPEKTSDLLAVLSFCIKDLRESGNKDAVAGFLKGFPIYTELLAPSLRDSSEKWPLPFVKSALTDQEPAEEAAPAKGKKGGAPPPAIGPFEKDEEGNTVIPERFDTEDEEEIKAQYKHLADIILVFADSCLSDISRIDHPESLDGVVAKIDPEKDHVRDGGIDEEQSEKKETSEDAGETEAEEGELEIPDPFALDSSQRIYMNCCSIVYFGHSENPANAIDAAVQLSNFIVDQWYHPTFVVKNMPNIMTALKEAIGALSLIMGEVGEVSDLGFEDDVNRPTFIDPETLVCKYSFNKRDVKTFLYSMKELCIFAIKVFWLSGDYLDTVRLGTDLLKIYVSEATSFCKPLGVACVPLVVHAQHHLTKAATDFHDQKIQDKKDFIQHYEEEQAKKRKKKLRIARLEKSPEELAFEANCDAYQGKIENALAALKLSESRLEQVLVVAKSFDTLSSTGVQLLDKVNKSTREFLEKCDKDFDRDMAMALKDREVANNLDDILYRYDQVVGILRDKKERLSVVDALQTQGDLLLMCGHIDEAKKIWNDAVDGLFNVMDACSNWKQVLADREDINTELLVGSIPLVIVLGKLCKYCAIDNLDHKIMYARFAAALSKIPFSDSVGHPTETYGYAAYCCKMLGGIAPMTMDVERIGAAGFVSSVVELINVLHSEGMQLEALPLVVLLEHFHACYTRDANAWVAARIQRIRLLTTLRRFAECASMIAEIVPAVYAIRAGTYENPLRPVKENDTLSLEQFDVSSNGLCFYGKDPYFNNQTPDSEDNNNAVQWIKEFGSQFEEFAATIRMELSPLELERMKVELEAAAAASAAAAEAEAANKKGKKKGGDEPETDTTSVTSKSIFANSTLIDLKYVCASFLAAVGMTESRRTSPHMTTLQTYIDDAETDLRTLLTTNISLKNYTNVADSFQLGSYGEIQLLLASIQEHRRSYREARITVMRLAERISIGPQTPTAIEDPAFAADVKYIATKLWFSLRGWQAKLAFQQARFQHVIKITTDASEDAKAVKCSFWYRKFLMLRATSQRKLGNFIDAESDYAYVKSSYEVSDIRDIQLVDCLLELASTKREMLGAKEGDPRIAANEIENCLNITREACDIAEALSFEKGFLGFNSNATHEANDTAVAKFKLLTPYMHNLTNIHGNEPPLIPVPTIKYNDQKTKEKSSRRTVIDKEMVYAKSHFANFYIPEVRSFAGCKAAKCLMIDEARMTGRCDNEALAKEQFIAAEAGLKLCRHVAYMPALVRVNLLIALGRCMLDISKVTNEFQPDEIKNVFDVAFQWAAKEIHPWSLMSKALLGTVETLNGPLKHSGSTSDRLKLSVAYMSTAIQLAVKQDLVRFNFQNLDDAQSFDKPIEEELLTLLSAHGYSGGNTPPILVKEDDVDAGNDKGKGKSKGGAPAGAGPEAPGSTGRDVLYLITGLLREASPLNMDNDEAKWRYDIHNLLKEKFAFYASDCVVEETSLPTIDSLTINASSISSYWNPAMKAVFDEEQADPEDNNMGVYSVHDLYLILGGVAEGDVSEDDPSSLSVITKVSLMLKDLIEIERLLLELGWLFKMATKFLSKPDNRQVALLFTQTIKLITNILMSSRSVNANAVMECDSNIDHDTQQISVTIDVDEGRIKHIMPVDEETIKCLTSIFINTKATDQFVHNNICTYLRIFLTN